MSFLTGAFRPKSHDARRALRLALMLPLALAAAALADPAVLGERFPDPDDAMRLVQIRDLLASGNWFDMAPPRLDPPQVMPTHWSRLTDVPLAALMLLTTPILGAVWAEKAALLLWPPMLFIPFVLVAARIARRLGGPAAMPGAVLLGASVTLVWQFFPGRIDHHAAQAVVASAALAFALERESVAAARLSGVMTGLALAMGLETAAVLGVVGLFFASDLIMRPNLRRSVAAYAVSASVTLVAAYVATTRPAHYLMSGCDGPTGTLILAALLAMASLYATSHVAPRLPPAGRAPFVVAAGLLAAAVALWLEPNCARGLAGAVDVAAKPEWLLDTSELVPLSRRFTDSPVGAVLMAALPLLGLAGAAIAALAGPRRRRAALEAGICLLVLSVIGSMAVRGIFLAAVVALGPIAAGVTMLLRRRGPSATPLAVRSMIAATAICFATYAAGLNAAGPTDAAERATPKVAAPAGGTSAAPSEGIADRKAEIGAAASPAPPPETAKAQAGCVAKADFRGLADLPRGLVIAPIWSGPYVLAWTHHDVMSSPHHRFKRGNDFAEAAMNGTVDGARSAMRERKIDYVVLCRDTPATGPFLAALKATPPEWLERVNGPGDELLVFRVVRAD